MSEMSSLQNANLTASHHYPDSDSEFVFSYRGQPFAAAVTSNCPAPTSTLIDFAMVRDFKMKMTDFKCQKFSFANQKLRIVGKISSFVQYVKDGTPLGQYKFSATVVRGLTQALDVDSIAGTKLVSQLTGQSGDAKPSTEPAAKPSAKPAAKLSTERATKTSPKKCDDAAKSVPAAVPSVQESEVVTTADIMEPEPASADPEPQNRDLEQKPAEDDVIPEVDKLGYLRNGFLKVTVHKAEDLVAKDIGGRSDPYVVIRYDGQKSKSKHIKSDLNPEFEFTTGYVVEEGGASDLVIEIRDHDLGKDESLGHCSFDLRQVLGQVNVECCQSILESNVHNCRGVLRKSGAV